MEKEKINIGFIIKNIWFSPRKIVRYIANTNSNAYQIILWIIAGFGSSLSKLYFEKKGNDFDSTEIILICLLAGSGLGILSSNLFAIVINWISQLLGGKGNKNLTLMVISWGFLPYFSKIVIYLLVLTIYGHLAFTPKFTPQSTFDVVFLFIIILIIFFYMVFYYLFGRFV